MFAFECACWPVRLHPRPRARCADLLHRRTRHHSCASSGNIPRLLVAFFQKWKPNCSRRSTGMFNDIWFGELIFKFLLFSPFVPFLGFASKKFQQTATPSGLLCDSTARGQACGRGLWIEGTHLLTYLRTTQNPPSVDALHSAKVSGETAPQ